MHSYKFTVNTSTYLNRLFFNSILEIYFYITFYFTSILCNTLNRVMPLQIEQHKLKILQVLKVINLIFFACKCVLMRTHY